MILFDQRGSGRSTPKGELRDNDLPQLIEDIEKIRTHLGIDRWLVFGGSWGSTLAIAYGVQYPKHCLGFILRGVFLMRQFEIDWFMVQVQLFFPDYFNEMLDQLELLSGTKITDRFTLPYRRILEVMQQVIDQNQVEKTQDMFAAFSGLEEKIMTHVPALNPPAPKEVMAVIGKIQHHYFFRNIQNDGALLSKLDAISHLPCTIVQGRYDMVCPPISAYELHKAWPGSALNMVVDGGHSAGDPSIEKALCEAMEQFKQTF